MCLLNDGYICVDHCSEVRAFSTLFSLVIQSVKHVLRHLGPHSRNFPKTFSKDLPMSNDLGIAKKFSFPNSQRLSLHFQRSSSVD